MLTRHAKTMSTKHMGSSLDDFLKEEGIFEEAQAEVLNELVEAEQSSTAKPESDLSNSHERTYR